MNHLLHWIVVGLLVITCAWGTQPTTVEDMETLSPNLLTTHEFDVQTEVPVKQPEIHANKTARAILDYVSYVQVSTTEKNDKNATESIATIYLSNASSSEKNTGNENSFNSPPSDQDSDREKANLLSKIVIGSCSILSLLVLSIITWYWYHDKLCCYGCFCRKTNVNEAIYESKPHDKHYRREVSFVFRSSHHKV
jgi:hypothetical protein